ncbi:MAG: sigma-54 dependent transcriptional regulator [Terriglobales bacterium]
MSCAAILPSASRGVLVASPSLQLREQVRRNLRDGAGPVQEVSGGADALVRLESGQWQLLFLDRRLPDLDAEELMQIVRVRFPGIEVVLIDSKGDSALPWPVSSGMGSAPWLRRQRPAASQQEADRISEATEKSSVETPPLPGMIGSSESMQRLYRLTRLVATHNTTVLVLGATGTGKELVARAIHQLSARAGGPWTVVNCAALPESLIESELFGYARGAFTGAVQAYAGRICSAQGGTLFLDEMGELPLNLQAKLLRFLEQKEVQRLGTAETLRVDVRVVAATNADLEQKVETGKFRSDLYYRLSAFPLELPPLAERREDIVPLAEHFLRGLGLASQRADLRLSAEAGRMLEAQAWSGNVRELQQVMERAAILAEDNAQILPAHLDFPARFRARPLAEESAQRRVF